MPPLPYADGRFSIVTWRFTCHHMPDPLAVLKEMRRVYARWARVVVVDMTPSAAHAEAFNGTEKLRHPSHVRAISVEELWLCSNAPVCVARTESYRWITNSKIY